MDLISTWPIARSEQRRVLEGLVREVYMRLEPSFSIDCGACEGLHTYHLLRYGDVLAIDPQIDLLNRMMYSYTWLSVGGAIGSSLYTSWQPLSDVPGPVWFIQHKDNPQLSCVTPEFGLGTEIEATTLDALLRDGTPNAKRVDFIKIDCERHDIKVLKGALKLLATDRPTVVFERDGPEQDEELIKLLWELPAHFYGIFSPHRPAPWSLWTIEGRKVCTVTDLKGAGQLVLVLREEHYIKLQTMWHDNGLTKRLKDHYGL